jgi:hypothetical protein
MKRRHCHRARKNRGLAERGISQKRSGRLRLNIRQERRTSETDRVQKKPRGDAGLFPFIWPLRAGRCCSRRPRCLLFHQGRRRSIRLPGMIGRSQSNRSPLERGTEIFDAETNRQTGPSAQQRPLAETHAGAKKPHSGAINARRLMKVSTQGLGGGDSRARTGDPPPSHRTGLRLRRERDFRPQRQRLKCRLFAGGDYVRRPAGIQKAPIPARQCDKGEQSSSPGDCLVGAPGLEPGTR